MEITSTTFISIVPGQVSFALRQLGVPVHLSGYRCLCVAIPIFLQEISQSMCNELYPAVAKELGYMDWRAVEFAIRWVIRSAWEHRNPDIWEGFFPGATKTPTNKQVIVTLAQWIQ